MKLVQPGNLDYFFQARHFTGGTMNHLALFNEIDDAPVMPVPETTSAESFARYLGGKVLRVGEAPVA